MTTDLGAFVYALCAAILGAINLFTSGSRFYYLRPTMHQYWGTVQTLLDSICANLGVSMTSYRSGENKISYEGNNILPDWMTTNSKDMPVSINAHAVASRAEALNVRMALEIRDQLARIVGRDAVLKLNQGNLIKFVEGFLTGSNLATSNFNLSPEIAHKHIYNYINFFSNEKYRLNPKDESTTEMTKILSNGGGEKSWVDNAKDFFKSASGAVNDAVDYTKEAVSNAADTTVNMVSAIWNSSTNQLFEMVGNNGYNEQLGQALLGELRDGHQWISFRTSNAQDSVSESVSNSLETAGIFGTYNDIADKARSFWFNTAGGNLGLGPLDSLVSSAITGVSETISSMVSTAPALKIFSPIVGLLNGAKIIEPKRWSSSSSTLSSANFKFELRTPYANDMSYIQDIIFPLCCLMALAFPRGAGPQSYGQPFFIQYYYKGRSQSKIGIVSSISITRGVGTRAWTKSGLPLGIDVDINIESVDDMLFVPLNTGVLGSLKNTISLLEENSMGDYLAVLSGLGLSEQEYFMPKMRRQMSALRNTWNAMLSPFTWSSYATSTFPGQIISKLSDATLVRN